jgi:adenine-specific DNA methylase
MTNRRLIELSIPLDVISAQSAREKSIRHGHISTLHIWWARRPLAACRAAVFAALVDAPEDSVDRERLERLIATIVDWDQVKDGNSPAIEEARRIIQEQWGGLPAPQPGKFYVYAIRCENDSIYIGPTNDLRRRWQEHLDGKASWTSHHKPVKVIHWEEYDSRAEAVEREKKLKTGSGRKWLKREYEAGRTRQAGEPPRVLDMFAGGGSIPLEALRLGCEAHALELNPVAYLILLCTLVYPQKYGQPMKRKVKQGAMEVEVEVNPLAEDVRRWGEWVLKAIYESEPLRERFVHKGISTNSFSRLIRYIGLFSLGLICSPFLGGACFVVMNRAWYNQI